MGGRKGFTEKRSSALQLLNLTDSNGEVGEDSQKCRTGLEAGPCLGVGHAWPDYRTLARPGGKGLIALSLEKWDKITLGSQGTKSRTGLLTTPRVLVFFFSILKDSLPLLSALDFWSLNYVFIKKEMLRVTYAVNFTTISKNRFEK